MKKVLIIASISGFITSFEKNNIKVLKKLGYDIFIATNLATIKDTHKDFYQENVKDIFHISFPRSPYTIKTLEAYSQLKKLLNSNHFDLIHCHTPVASLLSRIANRNSSTKLIYTAHGFHFYKGARLINKIAYFNLEKWLAKYTDILITMNEEDYKSAIKFKKCKVEFINGVGLDFNRFNVNCLDDLNKEIYIGQDEFILLNIGELSKRKNQIVLLKAMKKINNNKVKLLICGEGYLHSKYSKFINKYKLNVELLGHRSDIKTICKNSNVFIFPSIQEGLPVALMEAKACGLPIVCSQIRGNVDVIGCENEINTLLNKCNANSIKNEIERLFKAKYPNTNILDNKFSSDNISEKMYEIYKMI